MFLSFGGIGLFSEAILLPSLRLRASLPRENKAFFTVIEKDASLIKDTADLQAVFFSSVFFLVGGGFFFGVCVSSCQCLCLSCLQVSVGFAQPFFPPPRHSSSQ